MPATRHTFIPIAQARRHIGMTAEDNTDGGKLVSRANAELDSLNVSSLF